MKIGPFTLADGGLSIAPSGIEEWEEGLGSLVFMQRNIPWWIGDALVYGEARFGDDVYQAFPLDVSVAMVERYAAIARKIKPSQRNTSISYSHHVAAIVIKDDVARSAAMRYAARGGLSSSEFRAYIKDKMNNA